MTDHSKGRARQNAEAPQSLSHQAGVNRVPGRLQAIVNQSERRVKQKLEAAAAENGRSVYSKIRFADAVRIDNSGLPDELYRYAMQCHLDFLVVDADGYPEFAVEFDGEGHDTRRDGDKNTLCRTFGLPLARLDHRYLTTELRGIDAVGWLANVFFIARSMYKAQQNGQVPADEPVDPFTIIYSSGGSRLDWPLSYSLPAAARARQLRRERPDLPKAGLFRVVFTGGTRAAGVVSLRIGQDRFLCAEARAYLQEFPVSASEVAGELVMARFADRIAQFVAGAAASIDGSTAYRRMLQLTEGLRLASGSRTTARDPRDFWYRRDADNVARIVPPSGVLH